MAERQQSRRDTIRSVAQLPLDTYLIFNEVLPRFNLYRETWVFYVTQGCEELFEPNPANTGVGRSPAATL